MSLGVRHVSRRRKIRPKGFPTRESILKDALDILIYPVAIIAPAALVPQVYKLYTTQDVSSLSLPTWATLGCLNIVWLFYGWVHRERPIIITNASFMTLHFAIVMGILMFR
jgi:uncharacterized protein with PQ loop repeat